jgi:hypothetical protein
MFNISMFNISGPRLEMTRVDGGLKLSVSFQILLNDGLQTLAAATAARRLLEPNPQWSRLRNISGLLPFHLYSSQVSQIFSRKFSTPFTAKYLGNRKEIVQK